MALSTNGNIVVADSTPADVTYSEVSNTGSACVYSDRTRDIGVPRSIFVSHQKTGKDTTLRQRSMVKLTDCIENAALEGDVVNGGVHIVYDFPLRVYTKADIVDIQTQLVNLITSDSFVDKILNSEV